MFESRLDRIEENMTFLQKAADDLDLVLREFDARLTRLETSLQRHQETVQRELDGMRQEPGDEKPPHWGG